MTDLVLAYDTETTGLDQHPRLVELGAVLMTSSGDELAHVSLVVRPDGYEVPEGAARVHGWTTERATAAGVPLVVAISTLTNLWARAAVRVAYNAEYDDRVIDGEIGRLGRESSLARPPVVCVMDLATPVLNLPPSERMVEFGHGDKARRPSLAMAYKFLFDEDVVGAHRALVDARACARVYLELMRRKEGSVG